MKTLHISAGGRGERIAEYISSFKPFLPKHLLPIPTENKTLLGEIVSNAHPDFDDIRIWTSRETFPQISIALERTAWAHIQIDKHMTGPLGPMIRSLMTAGTRVYACAGDFYCKFSWESFEKFHDQSGCPISILVANSIPAPKGARFNIGSNGIVSSWERVEQTSRTDKINIGCYIIDPSEEVISGLEGIKAHKEDDFFELFIRKGLVSGYVANSKGYNINVAKVYESLLHELA